MIIGMLVVCVVLIVWLMFVSDMLSGGYLIGRLFVMYLFCMLIMISVWWVVGWEVDCGMVGDVVVSMVDFWLGGVVLFWSRVVSSVMGCIVGL